MRGVSHREGAKFRSEGFLGKGAASNPPHQLGGLGSAVSSRRILRGGALENVKFVAT